MSNHDDATPWMVVRGRRVDRHEQGTFTQTTSEDQTIIWGAAAPTLSAPSLAAGPKDAKPAAKKSKGGTWMTKAKYALVVIGGLLLVFVVARAITGDDDLALNLVKEIGKVVSGH